MNEFTKQIAESLAGHLPLGADNIEGMLEVPPKADMGDYAFPCFTLAKSMKKAPAKIAAEIAAALEIPALLKEVKATGPYLNFFVDRAEFTKRTLTPAIERGSDCGKSDS